MRKIYFLLTALCCATMLSAGDGSLPGKFSINADGDQVQFINGNLLVHGGASNCNLGTHWFQYSMLGANNIVHEDNYVYTDLLCWGTGDAPYQWGYLDEDFSQWTDWGINPIEVSRMGEQETWSEGWRTLTADEWMYLFTERRSIEGESAEDLFCMATVAEVAGIILIPEDNFRYFRHYTDYKQYYGMGGNKYDSNVLTAEEWKTWEEQGAVFLPAAGARAGKGYCPYNSTNFRTIGLEPNSVAYWTATPSSSSGRAKCICIEEYQDHGVQLKDMYWDIGLPVRLVKDVEKPLVTKNLTGRFSVSENESIIFAQGNLRYKVPSNTWQFADNQYDMLDERNKNASSTYNGSIDLFGFGTSGVAAQPWEISKVVADYAVPSEITGTIAGTDYDWTHYNTILNSGGHTWRLLSAAEWEYLLNTRENAVERRGQARVDGIKGTIFLPDNWTCPEGLTFTPNPNNFTANVYTEAKWEQMETAGAVFLPATGYRYGTSLVAQGIGNAFYWTGDFVDNSTAKVLSFNSTAEPQVLDAMRTYACPIRPVRTASAEGQEALEQITNDKCQMTNKVLQDGHILILRGDKTYTIDGRTVH